MRIDPPVSPRAVAVGRRGLAGAWIGACALLMAALGLPSRAAAQTRTEAVTPPPGVVDTTDDTKPAREAAGAAAQLPPPGPEARLHDRVNSYRASIGCRPLDWHAPSASVAEARSVDMLARRYFDHWTPEGRTVFDELAAAGIEAWGSIAENIALSQAGPASVLELWRDSHPHRRNLDNCSFTHQGLGERGGVWTQILLAQPKKAATPARVSPSEPASPPR